MDLHPHISCFKKQAWKSEIVTSEYSESSEPNWIWEPSESTKLSETSELGEHIVPMETCETSADPECLRLSEKAKR